MNKRTFRRAAANALLIAAGSCCSKPELEVGSMGGRLDFGFDLAFEADFDLDMRIDFDFDLAAWCDIGAASQANIDFDFTGMQAFEQTIEADVDDDGVAETVTLIAFAAGDPSQPERVFASWQGDAYTYDAGRCYLLWWEGDGIELLNAACGGSEPALHCTMTRDERESLECDVCDPSGSCAACNEGTVAACVDEGERTLDARPSGTGGRGSGGSAGSAGSGGGGGSDAGAAGLAGTGSGGGPAGGSGGAPSGGSGGSGGSVTIDFDTCMSEAASLASRARDCGLGELRDSTQLCTDRVSDVNVCYVAVEGAAFMGAECDALDSAACTGVFP